MQAPRHADRQIPVREGHARTSAGSALHAGQNHRIGDQGFDRAHALLEHRVDHRQKMRPACEDLAEVLVLARVETVLRVAHHDAREADDRVRHRIQVERRADRDPHARFGQAIGNLDRPAVEHRLQVGRRLRYNPHDLAGCGLLLERALQIATTLIERLTKARIFGSRWGLPCQGVGTGITVSLHGGPSRPASDSWRHPVASSFGTRRRAPPFEAS